MLEGLLPSMKNEEEEELLREKLREKEKAKFEEDSDNEDEGKKEKVKYQDFIPLFQAFLDIPNKIKANMTQSKSFKNGSKII